MTQEQFQQASGLFKAGDKLGAERILLGITHEEPENADAWYALALCAGSIEDRKARLEKCLTISPDHSRALNSLAKLHEPQKPQFITRPETSPTADSEVADAVDIQSKEKEPLKSHKPRISSQWIYAPILLILVGLVAWQFIRIDSLEKKVVTIDTNVKNNTSSINSINNEVTGLNASINLVNGDIHTLAAGLDYLTPLAENANKYAHSHTTIYSDARLKTNITEIQNSLEKVLQLRGVYFQWNVAGYPQMNLSDQPQVGVIAQEVEKVFPELVSTDANGFKQVDYEKLSAVLIEAIKEQQKEINTLANQINP